MKVGDLATTEPEPEVDVPITKVDVPKTDIMIINPNDPYDTPEERAEMNDWLFRTFFGWSGEDGTFSCWRERHVFLRGFRNGFGTSLFQKFTDVPAMWNDEAQYYEAGQEFGYVVKIGVQITTVFIATQLGILTIFTGGIDATTTTEIGKELLSQILSKLGGLI